MRTKLFSMLMMLLPLLGLAQSASNEGPLFPVMKDGKLGYINADGEIVVSLQYDPVNNSDLPSFEDGLITFSKGWKRGLLDANGNVIVEPKYDRIRSFNKDGYAAVEVKEEGSLYSLNNKTGYIDKEGNVVIGPIYTMPWFTSSGLHEGMVAVSLPETYGKGRQGYVGIDGTEYFTKNYFTAGDYKFGMAPVKEQKETLAGYIDKSGNWVIKPQFSYAYPFTNEGVAQVSFEDKSWGLIDKTGKVLLKETAFTPVSFLGGGSFSNGLMLVKSEDKYGFIDATGKLVIPLKFDYASGGFNSDGYAVVNNGCTKTKGSWGTVDIKGGTWMLIDKQGNVKKTFSGNYDEIYSFSQGVAVVEKDDKYGYINMDGEVILPVVYDERPERFNNGLGRYYANGEESYAAVKPFGYIDKNGKIIWQPSK